MKIIVQIPKGKYCGKCQFCVDKIGSYSCAYFKKDYLDLTKSGTPMKCKGCRGKEFTEGV